MTARWLAGIAVLCVFGACREGETRTQTIVMIDATPLAKGAVAHVNVKATSLDDASSRELSSDGDWPVKLVFAPKNEDASRHFKLELSARGDDSAEVVGASLTMGFVAHAVRYATVTIDDGCAQPDNASCVDSSCNSFNVDAASLGTSLANPLRLTLKCKAPGEITPPDTTTQNNTLQDGGITTLMDATAGNAAGHAGVTAAAGNGGSGPVTPPTQAGSSGGPTMIGPCRDGYEARNGDCSDVDECAAGKPCGMHGSCENTQGSYMCHCEAGFAGDRGPCADVDECTSGTSGCAGSCINEEGGFHCECQEGSWLKADGKGCARFGRPQKVNFTSSTVLCTPQIAMDEAGRGLAVWIQGDGNQSELWTNRYTPGTGWGLATKLATSGSVESPRVALDPQGNGLVIWVQTGANHKDLWGARYAATGKFEFPKPLESEDAGDVSSPKLTLDANGNGFAVWTYYNGSRTEIWADRWLAETPHFLGAGRVVGNENIGVVSAEISLDASGAGNMVWTQFNITDGSTELHFAPWTQHFDPTTGWSSLPRLLDLTTDSAGLPDIQLEAHGSGNVVWRRVGADGGSIMVRGLDGATLAPLKLLSPSVLTPQDAYAVVASQPRIASSPAGNAAAVWSDTTGGVNRVYGSTYRSSTSEWAAAISLSPGASTQFTPPQVALDADGYGFGVWTDCPATNTRVIRAQRVHPETGFGGAVVDIDSDLTPSTASPVRFALDAHGVGVLVWDRQNAMQYEVWAARLE
jgi:hypothetical protein